MDEINFEELDPGIRETVRRLRRHGFETTDSGDGVSKPADWYQPDEHGITQAMNFPHVICLTSPDRLIADAQRLVVLFPTWQVEATYYPRNDKGILMISKLAGGPAKE